jgi:hypothetical protein
VERQLSTVRSIAWLGLWWNPKYSLLLRFVLIGYYAYIALILVPLILVYDPKELLSELNRLSLCGAKEKDESGWTVLINDRLAAGRDSALEIQWCELAVAIEEVLNVTNCLECTGRILLRNDISMEPVAKVAGALDSEAKCLRTTAGHADDENKQDAPHEI